VGGRGEGAAEGQPPGPQTAPMRPVVPPPTGRPRPSYALPALAGGAALLVGIAAFVVGGPGKGEHGAQGTGSPVATASASASAAPAITASASATAAPVSSGCPGDMVLIPGGTFQMGSPEGVGDDDEHPQHAETVATFCMDKTEVTVAAYRACVDRKACSEPNKGTYGNWGMAGRDDHPINYVDWKQAKTYCESSGKRLPLEKEWEYAARGAEGRTYPWGDKPAPSNQLCWNGEGSDLGKGTRTSTCKVGSHPAGNTPLGLQDMAGNVWEWVDDLYRPDQNKNHTEKARVFRGGGWNSAAPSLVRGANRLRDAPSVRDDDVGFRCARAN